MSENFEYVLLVLGLFVVPVLLQRYRIPGAVTSLALGVLAAATGFFHADPTISLLATFGIVALFLFAGLEVDLAVLRRELKGLALFAGTFIAALVAAALVSQQVFGYSPRLAWLIALVLLTPSTGFILDSLRTFALDDDERARTKRYGIAAELIALAALFVVMQSSSIAQLATASVSLAALILVIPVMLRFFAVRIVPWAPRTEFAFLIVLGVICAYVTRELGVYYLVGAFLVGVAARRFEEHLPALSSERMLHAVEDFGKLFAPIYFFNAGTHVEVGSFAVPSLFIGLTLAVGVLALRVGLVMLVQARVVDGWRSRLKVATALSPTLVFSLVLIEILRTSFSASDMLLDALLVYTLVATLVPGFALGAGRLPPAAESAAVADGLPEVIR